MVIVAFLQIGQLLPMTIGGNVTTRLIDNQGTLTRPCNTSGRPSAGFIPTRSLALPSHPYGKAVKPAFPIGHAGLCSSPWAPSPSKGLPLSLPRTGETVAVRAVHRLARPHAQSARPRRPSVPDRRPANAQMPGQAGQKGKAVKRLCQLPPEASTVTDSCWFNPSQPPKGGAINARALSSLRITVGAKNPRHNITQHCITPRGKGRCFA